MGSGMAMRRMPGATISLTARWDREEVTLGTMEAHGPFV